MSLRFRLVLAGACALLAAMLCVLCAQQAREGAERERNEALARYGGETVGLVVATDALEAGDVVAASNVTERDWLSDLAPADAVTSLDDVLGRTVTVPVASGAPLTSLNFREEAPMAQIPAGHVAVSVPVTDRLGLAANVSVGARVIAYQAAEGASELLCDDVSVLAVPASDKQAMRAGSITVAVPPDAVARVLSAASSGDLRLVQPADDVDGASASDVAAPGEVTAQPEVSPAGEAGQDEASGDETVGSPVEGSQDGERAGDEA